MLPLFATILTLPADFVATSTAYIGDLFTDLSPIIILIFGLVLGMWVIRFVLSLVRSRGK